jgi:hypothetical protein
MATKTKICLDMTPYNVIQIYHCFGGTSYFHLVGSRRRHVGKLCIKYRDRKKGCSCVGEPLGVRQAGEDGARKMKEAGNLSTHR